MNHSTLTTSSPTTADDSLWRGVLDRSETLDGRIFYAVRSTGIYCRPSCPSRRPLRRNVLFFRSPDAAEHAGYRPCKRCVPRVHAEAAEGRMMAEEMRVAAEIQRALLPSGIRPPEGWDLAFDSTPCGEVGGDHLDVFQRRRDAALVLALGDVTGKGVPAALSTSCLHAGLRAQIEARPDLPGVVAELDRYLAASTPANRFASLFCALLEPGTGWFTYVNAGHPPALLASADGTLRRLEASGLVLGLLPGHPFSAQRVRLRVGDALLVYSDGVTEAVNRWDEELGMAPLAELLAECRGEPAAAVGHRLEQLVDGHAGSREPADDRSWLVLRRVAEA